MMRIHPLSHVVRLPNNSVDLRGRTKTLLYLLRFPHSYTNYPTVDHVACLGHYALAAIKKAYFEPLGVEITSNEGPLLLAHGRNAHIFQISVIECHIARSATRAYRDAWE